MLNDEIWLIGPVDVCARAHTDKAGNLERILKSLKAKTVYLCLYSENLERRCQKRSRCLRNIQWKAVWAGGNHAKEFRLEAVSKRGPVFLYEPINNTVVSN